MNGSKSNFDALSAELLCNGTMHQLVYIELREGKIKNINIANQVVGIPSDEKYSDFSLNYQADVGVCTIRGGNINSQFMAGSNTKAFYISLDMFGNVDEDEIMAGDYRQLGLTNPSTPKVRLYDVNIARIPGAVVVYGTSGKISNSISGGRLGGSNAIVVEGIVHRLDSDGEVRPYIEGMLVGLPISLYPANGVSIDEVRPGDVIKFTYKGKELRSYSKLFTLTPNSHDDSTVLSPDKLYSEDHPAYNNLDFTSKLSIEGLYGVVEEVGASADSTSVSYQNDRAPSYSLVIRPEGTTDDGKLVTVNVSTARMKDNAGTFVYVYNTRTNTVYSISPTDIELTGKKVYCYINQGTAKAIIYYE